MLLLGQLVRLGSGDADMKKEVHSSLVILLLNLSDPIPEVTQVKTHTCTTEDDYSGVSGLSAAQDTPLGLTKFQYFLQV